jgi:hypothetical protein
MASSLLDRVKRPAQSAETFIAAADEPAKIAPVPTSASATTHAVIAPTPVTETSPEIAPTPAITATPKASAPRARRSAGEDPRKYEVPRYTFNLRLNDYELELLRALADEQRESMQKIVKNGLIPYLEGLRKASKNSNTQ